MNKKLLIIGFVWPEPKSSAAGARMMQLIFFFQSNNYQITFATACAKSDNAFDLSGVGVETASIQLNNSSFDTFVLQMKPNVVIFDRFMTEEQFGWRVQEQCPEAIRILDTEDLHFLRRARKQALKDNSKVTKDYLFSDTAKREIASIYRCDLSLIISNAEMELLKTTFSISGDVLYYLPFLVEPISEEKKNDLPNFEERHHFITIGNFLHEPNFDALLYLKETLWKPIKQRLPNAELHNYGAYANQKVNQLHNEKEGFLIKGFTDHVDKVMQHAKVVLAPIRFGAGLKGKLFDAMHSGTPFVTTTIGLEGIENEYSEFLKADTTETFIEQAVSLYQVASLWKSQQVFGFQVLNAQFSKVKFEKEFANRIEELSNDLKTHREQNFIGQLLHYHTMQSTKFMSKWIASKNT